MIGLAVAVMIIVGNPIKIQEPTSTQITNQVVTVQESAIISTEVSYTIDLPEEQDIIESVDIQTDYIEPKKSTNHNDDRGWIEIEWDAIEVIDETDNNGWIPIEWEAIEVIEEE